MGASQVCTAVDDIECYGNYYQWGRDNADFDVAPDYPYDWVDSDDDGSLRVASWRKTDGSSICPVGYRVPTITELAAEITSADNNTDVFNSFLKLPSAGFRSYFSGSMFSRGSDGFVWSSSATYPGSYYLWFGTSTAGTYLVGTYDNGGRAYGGSVRCLKD